MSDLLVPAENNLNRITGFVMLPSELFEEKQFQNLSCDAKVLYGKLLSLLRLSCMNTDGQWRSNGRPFVSLSRKSAGYLLHCRRDTAARAFEELERCGLVEAIPQVQRGKAKKYYINLPRPKQPNEI